MKKKLMLSMLTTLMFGMFILATLFIFIENYQYKENIKQILKTNNDIIINVLKNENIKNKESFFKANFKNEEIRETFIDRSGKVLSDSIADPVTMDNHNGREEVQNARKYGEGYSIRHSFTLGQDTIYFATTFSDGYVVRSSMTIQAVRGIEGKYFKYYMAVLTLSVAFSVLFASKLSQSIAKPIKNLEFTTSRIAEGELYRRVKIYSDDEIGNLAKTFDNMADKLQETINDSLDKQNKLEAILRSMDSGVIAVDRNHKVIIINPYAKRIFGINRNIIGENLMDNIRDFELENIFEDNNDDYKELKILWPKERELRIRTADIINNKDKIGTVAVVNDITDIKKFENMRSQFVANVSHELKTPLTSIKGFAETLRYVDDPANKEKFLGIINDEADRLTRLINDILILSNIENETNEKVEEIKVNSIVNDVCYLMKNLAKKKEVNLTIELKEVPDLLGDCDRFKQMIINLVDNAIKYTDCKGSIKVQTNYLNNNCIISIEDTGVGIPKEHIERLFERFYRVDKARSRAQGGTGLGLAIVKHIVMLFNGTISVESEVGRGSRFIIKIPC
ncbi:HAMP domain-containing protein [Clostridiaceae bacterium UIB06]|uniref:histidine kinase n=1 Tax=Clostridium thailandense TaxID=2794346 RepID=A0A949TMB5_9CLOT|nr:ATP-binding protein [Clostridium thailandense]MBV7271917.1 HAMP domain-containing protein [Clostridium thailandense]MCH5137143.1 HAMP domain-containing protein [Clostridiaceae bacterium UIB06]